MIVWSGRGFLSIIILFVTLFICTSIIPPENASYGFIITAFVTGIFSWYFGKKWNAKNERIVIDEKTGQRLRIKNNHSLFWIPMQYWGIIFSALGIFILFQNSMIFGIIATMILLTFILIPLINQKPKTLNKSETFEKNKSKINSEVKKTNSSSEIISELKKESSSNQKFEPSDHSKFMPK